MKILTYFYRLALLEQKVIRWVIALPGHAHMVVHSFVATACRTPSSPHKKIAQLFFYYAAFSIIQFLPNPYSGWYFLHMAFGAGYYQYRLTLIGVVDNFKVVELHAVGYITWRKFWRHRLYPWLVKRFPRWGYFTTLLVWCQHLFVGQGITKLFSVKVADLLRLTLPIRYSRPGLSVHYATKVNLRVFQEHRQLSFSLVDHEKLSLDNVFPFPRFEPFQEEFLGHLEDQQDVHLEQDEEPNVMFDLEYGTNEGSYLVESEPVLFRDKKRRRFPTRKAQPYRRVTNVTGSFDCHSYRPRGVTLGRLLDPGQGPASSDEEELDNAFVTDDYDPGEERQQLSDWYFLSLRTPAITDSDLLQSDFGGMWRQTNLQWIPGVLTAPERHYLMARTWKRWWWWSRRLQTHRYHKTMKRWGFMMNRLPTIRSRRQKLAQQQKKLISFRQGRQPSRSWRPWWFRQRRDNLERWLEWPGLFEMWGPHVSSGLVRGKRQLPRGWKKLIVSWFHSGVPTPGVSFAQRRGHPQGFTLGTRWTHSSKVTPPVTEDTEWVATVTRPQKEALRQSYPRYRPAYSQGASLDQLGNPTLGAPTPGVGLVGLLIVGFIVLTNVFDLWLYLTYRPPGPWTEETYEWGENFWYQWSHPGLLSWAEVYRLAPPRGFHTWPALPGGLDGNLYVWSWWVDFWETNWYPQTYHLTSAPQLVAHSHWKWYLDEAEWYNPSWPPYLPSWAHLIGKIGSFNSYAYGLEKIEMPTYFRGLDKFYFEIQAVQPWLISQIFKGEEARGIGTLTFTKWWDATQTTWGSHLTSPVWVNPRDPWGHPHLDARYVRFWEASSQLLNHCADVGMYRSAFYNLGRADETLMWPHLMEDALPGWTFNNLPGKWEIYWNQNLLLDWVKQSNEFRQNHRDGQSWFTTLWPRWVTWVQKFYPTWGFIWLVARCAALAAVLATLLRPGWFQPGPPGVVQVGLTHRAAPTVLARASTVGAAPLGAKIINNFNRSVTHQGESPQYDEFGFSSPQVLSWRWSRWENVFAVARSGEGHHPYRGTTYPAGLTTRIKAVPRPVHFHSSHPSPTHQIRLGRIWWAARVVPIAGLTTRAAHQVCQAVVLAPDHRYEFFLSPGVSLPAPINPPDRPARGIRHTERKFRRMYRLVSTTGTRPAQYSKPYRRYRDLATRTNPRLADSRPTLSGPTSSIPQTRFGRLNNPHNQIRLARMTRLATWTHLVGHSCSTRVLSQVEELLLLELLQTNYPGRNHLYQHQTPKGGHDWGLYQDDQNNEPFLGTQSDEDFDEFEDVENPFECYQELATYTPVSTAAVVLPLHATQVTQLLSWSRWCGLPLGWYRGQPGGSQTYLGGVQIESFNFGILTGEHPTASIFPGLAVYEISRFYRRLTRWSEFTLPPALPALYRPTWGNTTTADYHRGATAAAVAGRRARLHRVLQLHGGGDGGDLTTPVATALWDELQQTGWGPQGLTLDDGLLTSLGQSSQEGYVDHSYRGYCRAGCFISRPGWAWASARDLDTAGNGITEVLDGKIYQIDPEAVLFEWWSPTYWVDGYSVEAQYLDHNEVEREPEDCFHYSGEYNPEVARPRPQDLPGWIVAAAVAGAHGEQETNSAAQGQATRPGTRLWWSPQMARLYRRHWLRQREQPWWWRSRLWGPRWIAARTEISGGVEPVGPGIAGNPIGVNLDDHVRVWALTEVYFRDRPHGRGLPG